MRHNRGSERFSADRIRDESEKKSGFFPRHSKLFFHSVRICLIHKAMRTAMDYLWAPWRMEYIGSAPKEACFLCAAWAENAEAERIARWEVARGENALVLLNRYPYNSGHLLVAPSRHAASFDALTEQETLECWRLAAQAKKTLTRLMKPDGFNIGINEGHAGGAGVPGHLHIHIVPRWEGDHNYMTALADVRVVPQALEATCARLREAFGKE
jgi:ATP adenylyltransferase